MEGKLLHGKIAALIFDSSKDLDIDLCKLKIRHEHPIYYVFIFSSEATL